MAETKHETKAAEPKDALVAFVTPLLRGGEVIAEHEDDKGKMVQAIRRDASGKAVSLTTTMGRRFEMRGDTFLVTSGLPKGAHNEMAWNGKSWVDGAGATITL